MPDEENALIGHTGFVGNTLSRSDWQFSAKFNSSNIDEIRGRSFETVICAGVSAVKWKANRDPDADWAGILRLIEALETIRAERFVLISTVDIYPHPCGVDEGFMPVRGIGESYGRHRFELEVRVAEQFSNHNIVRLPALFGLGLKKNAVYDLLVGNMVDRLAPNSSFQWYPMRRFAADLKLMIQAGLPLMNVAVEPVLSSEIVDVISPLTRIGSYDENAVRYDVQTNYAEVLGGEGRYHIDAATSLAELKSYADTVKQAGGVP